MNLIVRVRSGHAQAPVAHLLDAPMGLDVWQSRPDHLVLRAADAQVNRLRQMGYDVEELHQTDQFLDAFATDENTAAYHSVATLEQDLRRLAGDHPEIAELREIGRSVENRPIWALRIGERRAGTTRKLLFMGCHHAREWIAVEVPYLLAEHLLTHSGEAPIRDWLSQGELWVAPMVNPDGHEFCRTTNRLWRKNRRRNADGSFGVDPNRNYGYMWGTLNVNTSSHVPSDDTYVGPRAFSEPETRAARDLIAREFFKGVITYHSFSQLILYPWGYTRDPIPDPADRNAFSSLAERMQQLIEQVHGEHYTPEQASQLYPAAGDTTDWAFGIYGIPAYTIELRPDSVEKGGFILPADQIQPTWEENRPAAVEFIQRLL
jgi:carboxypeptidase T